MDRRSFLQSLLKLAGTATIGFFIQACSTLLGGKTVETPGTSYPTTIRPSETLERVENETTPHPTPAEHISTPTSSHIALVLADDRVNGLARALKLLSLPNFAGKQILVKPNFNSADPPPGSTHPEILRQLTLYLKEHDAGRIIVADRSGMGNTRQVFSTLGIMQMAQELAFETMIFDELEESEWLSYPAEGTHWERGFALPRILQSVDLVIQTCCLKTHRFGGHFTMALKNSIGLVAKTVPGDPYNYMTELHNSPDQRKMIAEVNAVYTPDLVILDGFEAFTSGGPDRGTKIQPGVIIAGTDRVAIDAIGVAILRKYGTTPEVENGSVFDQDQIARAIDLNLGAPTAKDITILSDSMLGTDLADEIKNLLAAA